MEDPHDQRTKQLAHWRRRVLIWSIVGYAIFYFVRKNLPVAMPVMEKQLGITKANLGLFLTLHGLLYGVSKFVNGMVGDRTNARRLMVTGLLLSAGLNVWFGMSSTVVMLGVVWMANGWAQGMGFPPCARLLTHWFRPKELATKMSIWNMSHSIGLGAVTVLCGYLVTRTGNWRLCFFVPAGLAAVVAVLLVVRLPDTPASVGMPEMVQIRDESQRPAGFNWLLRERVFANPYIWLVSGANFFVYTIRYAVVDWGPTMLHETRGMNLASAGWVIAAFEAAGMTGALLAGWMTDRFLGGRANRTSVVYMALCGAALVAFWRLPGDGTWLSMGVLIAAGFFVYGPQCLVAISAANLATKECAATAIGLTGIFGYASTVLSGWGLGLLVQKWGWDWAFGCLIGVCVCGVVLFAMGWGARADGYGADDVEPDPAA